SQWDGLSALLKEQPSSFKKIVYTHYLNLPCQEEKHVLFPSSSSFRVLVTLPVNEPRLQQALETLRRYAGHGMNAEFLFVISGEKEFTEAEELIDTYGLENHDFRPFYNGCRSFFEENVFIDKDDILEARPTLKEIAARGKVNPLHFGTLTVLSNGAIHANVNERRLGTLERDGISDAVYKEMYRGKSWRRIRKKVEPCRHCVFEALCPPLSNYEYVLSQNAPCWVSRL
ncbi:MAG: hypothetical protein GY950_33445, partial [bacterium]|nr:hypothetical protein [bacterium]